MRPLPGPQASCWRLALGLGLLLTGQAAEAHDIPDARVDRAIQVVLEPGRLVIRYEVGLAELTVAQDLRRLLGSIPGADREAILARYGKATGPLNAKGFRVLVDDREVPLAFEDSALAVEEHPRYTFTLGANLPAEGFLEIRDTNYEASEGTSRLALRADPGVEIEGYDGPSEIDEVESRPVWMLSDEEEEATKSVRLRFRSEAAGSRLADESATPVRVPKTASIRATGPSREANPLSKLLDRSDQLPALGLWLLAVGLGAAHSLQPGHGKTLVAAATLGGPGGAARGMLLALATTASHFGVVLGIAGALWASRLASYPSADTFLTKSAGLIVAISGFWRLGRHFGRLDGRVAMASPGSGPNSNRAETLPSARGLGELLGVGLAAGLVPCWDAVLLIVLAGLAGRLGLGLFLLSGFSLGMAATLATVGVVAGRVRGRFGREGAAARGLGLAAGLALAGIGVYLFFG